MSVPNDWRHISNGREIPTDTYSDQPYIVRTDDGAWLCTVTTGSGHEGGRRTARDLSSQHRPGADMVGPGPH